MLEIRLLGELAIVRDGRELPLPASKKTRALLGFLAATGELHLRERLCELLWDGPDDPRAGLRWSLSKLRPLLDDGAAQRLEADRERVRLHAPVAEVDWLAVRQAVGERGATADLPALRTAAERFRGEFLDGLDLPDCFRFHAWCAAERETARSLRVAILEALVARLRDQPEEALKHARARLAIDPLAESAHAQVVRCLGALGRTRDALRQCDEARRLLAAELGARSFAEIDRARDELTYRTEAAPAPPDTPAPSARPESHGLVGRAEERRHIAQLVEAAQKGAAHAVLLLSGEPGIGKSRLLAELGHRMRAAGGRVLAGRAFEAELVRPYGAWIDALRALGPGEVPAALRDDLAPLFPNANAPTGERARLFDATVALLVHLAPAGRPLAVLFDDVHWLDDSSTALLHFVARSDALGRVVIACAARSAELADQRAALKVVRALDRDQRLRALELTALDATETAQLVAGLGADAAQVFAESGGHPLFALEVAGALARGEDVSSLDGLIRERIDRLDVGARSLLPIAAALGESCGAELLAAVAGLSPAELMTAVDELERHGILRAGSGASWDFAHDLFRRSAYRRLSEPRRRLLHHQIAQALARLGDPDGTAMGALLHHAVLGGDLQLAARACLAAGERCLRVAAPAEAAKAAARGQQLLDHLSPDTRVELEIPLLQVAVFARTDRRRRRDLDAALSCAVLAAQAAGRSDRQAVGFSLLATLNWQEDNFARAEESTLRSVEAARTADPAGYSVALAHTSRCLALLERAMPRAVGMAFEAQAVAERHHQELPEVLWALTLAHHFRGDLAPAHEAGQRAAALYRRSENHWGACMCLVELATIDLEEGRYAAARDWAAQMVQVAEKLGAGSEEPFAQALLALADYAEEAPSAAARLERALAALADVDAKSWSSYALAMAAQLDLAAGRLDEAQLRAEAALAAASVVERASQVACARALLLTIALARRDRSEARRLARQLAASETGADAIGARAQHLVETSLRALKRSS